MFRFLVTERHEGQTKRLLPNRRACQSLVCRVIHVLAFFFVKPQILY